MRFTVTQQISCGLTISCQPSIKQSAFKIDRFTFLPRLDGDFGPDGNYPAERIQVTMQARTPNEAKARAQRLFTDFFAKLTLIDNSKYLLREGVSVSYLKEGVATSTRQAKISGKAFIVKGINGIKKEYENIVSGKSPRKKPLRLYQDAICSTSLFEKYRNFYRVLECYDKTKRIDSWITKPGKVEMKKYKFRGKIQNVTVFSWLRQRMSHSRYREGVEPLLISNPQHTSLVQKYLPQIQELARKKIKEKEKI